jgi:NAD(P)-dependent dehydrogenase (short-subunit alcohol dehydrogenase family)
MAHAVAPEAIAGVIAFLVSEVAAPVSGAILPVYGGWRPGQAPAVPESP